MSGIRPSFWHVWSHHWGHNKMCCVDKTMKWLLSALQYHYSTMTTFLITISQQCKDVAIPCFGLLLYYYSLSTLYVTGCLKCALENLLAPMEYKLLPTAKHILHVTCCPPQSNVKRNECSLTSKFDEPGKPAATFLPAGFHVSCWG